MDILERISAFGPTKLAKKIGIKPPVVSSWLSGTRPIPVHRAPELAAILGCRPEDVSPRYKAGVDRAHKFQVLQPIMFEPQDAEGYNHLQDWTVFCGIRPEQGVGMDGESKPKAFRSEFMRAMGWTEETHFTAKVIGDSMIEAGIRSGWSVVVDAREIAQRLRRGDMYALRRGDEFHVKYLEHTPDGGLKIISANSANPQFREPEILTAEQVDDYQIEILGTVVFAQGLMSKQY